MDDPHCEHISKGAANKQLAPPRRQAPAATAPAFSKLYFVNVLISVMKFAIVFTYKCTVSPLCCREQISTRILVFSQHKTKSCKVTKRACLICNIFETELHILNWSSNSNKPKKTICHNTRYCEWFWLEAPTNTNTVYDLELQVNTSVCNIFGM